MLRSKILTKLREQTNKRSRVKNLVPNSLFIVKFLGLVFLKFKNTYRLIKRVTTRGVYYNREMAY